MDPVKRTDQKILLAYNYSQACVKRMERTWHWQMKECPAIAQYDKLILTDTPHLTFVLPGTVDVIALGDAVANRWSVVANTAHDYAYEYGYDAVWDLCCDWFLVEEPPAIPKKIIYTAEQYFCPEALSNRDDFVTGRRWLGPSGLLGFPRDLMWLRHSLSYKGYGMMDVDFFWFEIVGRGIPYKVTGPRHVHIWHDRQPYGFEVFSKKRQQFYVRRKMRGLEGVVGDVV